MVLKHKTRNKEYYKYFCNISTRWNDNDVRWHVNNAKYYEFFDTVINNMLFDLKSINLKHSKDIFVTAETGCKYFEEISFPDKILAGLKIDHIGNSSIKYNIGLFKNDNINISAQGLFVHVLINKDTNKPTSIPLKLKDDLKSYAWNV